ncbi:phosphopantetheine attachment site domain protein [Azorhizobium oxalatiphilum]|uniref:Phosphopantetheine attachment site domain protein n=1 Tax=Azorhizobium oxalatiphilum TaxID=980631 RepID=A0A917BPC8_9HYPH|nr:acyl carrier protein [Azorhizobium oxalatiphilum]GGF51731.1 phosphopantetheine attachment site domain protein [Azorhizobium oxalatiphilum]
MPSLPDITDFCRERLAATLEIEAAGIAPDATFASLGLDSAMAVHFVLEIEDRFGVELYPSVTEDYPTVETFAGYVATLAA